ncbi:LOW QUALITY PROTEIN: E3 ubiquitin-protein ligase TRIM15-like [Phoenicopterus ruber ruber]
MQHWVSLRELWHSVGSSPGRSVLGPFPPRPSSPPLRPLGLGKPQRDVPGRVGSSGRPDQGWTLSPPQSCWAPAGGHDQLLSLLVAWRQFLLPENPDVVTLDASTAHSELVLSEDLRRVTRKTAWLNLLSICGSAEKRSTVLGQEGFREGRHCWQLGVEGKVLGDSQWAVGVARESVETKEHRDLSPEGGVWALRHWKGQFMSLTSPPTLLPLVPVPRRIWVCLDCTQGLVTFINADSGGEIFTFPTASFNGDIIRPWFLLGTEETQLCLRGSTSTLCPPSIPPTAPHSPCPPPPTARSPLLHAAAADVPPCPAQAQAAEGEGGAGAQRLPGDRLCHHKHQLLVALELLEMFSVLGSAFGLFSLLPGARPAQAPQDWLQ